VGLPLRSPESLELRMTYITRSWHKLLMLKAPCLSTWSHKCAWGFSHRPGIWSHLLGCLGRQSQTKHLQSFAGLLGASVTDQAFAVICWVAWGISHRPSICSRLLSCLGRQSQTKHLESFAEMLGASVTVESFAGFNLSMLYHRVHGQMYMVTPHRESWHPAREMLLTRLEQLRCVR